MFDGLSLPIHQTVAYEFDDAQHGADLYALLARRTGSPQAVAKRLAGLMGALNRDEARRLDAAG